MFPASAVSFVVLSLLLASQNVVARERWLERDGRAVFLHPRRFGQEHPAVIDKLSAACPGQVCGVLAGKAITPLLAAQPECSQQDMADEIIDAAAQFDAATQANMIALAVEYRQAEKNTPPDFTTNPNGLRNSVFCQKAPKNAQLNGLVQAQDPSNDPDLFFDPAKPGASVKKGTQANTSPFGGAAAAPAASSAAASSTAAAATSTKVAATSSGVLAADPAATDDCVTTVTVTVTGANAAATGTATVIDAGDATSTSVSAAPTDGASAGIGNFGKCSVPEIEFGVGFDNRKETSFEPKDKTSFNHGSAQNIDIITQFICDTLTNTCGADQTAKDTCQKARTAASGATKGTGAQADAFNGVFGIPTTFVDTPSVDNQGNIVPGTGKAGATASSTASAAGASSTGSSGIGNFGKCTVPQIEFGVGFDNRKETSFQPVDKTSYNHGSAQAIGIITQFICDTLTNSCGADATAKQTCQTATTAAAAAAAKTGAQADAFNKVMGITTNFANVTPIDDQGRAVSSTAAAAATTTSSQNLAVTSAPSTTSSAPAMKETSSSGSSNNNNSSSNSSNLQTFSGALGGVQAPAVTQNADGSFQVAGNSSFNQKSSALQRSCDVQNNKCADAANASGNKDGFTVSACNQQQQTCLSQVNSS